MIPVNKSLGTGLTHVFESEGLGAVGGSPRTVAGQDRHEMTLGVRAPGLSLPVARAALASGMVALLGEKEIKHRVLPQGLADDVPGMLVSALTLGGASRQLTDTEVTTAPGLFAKMKAVVVSEPFADIVTLPVVRNQFSPAAQKKINDRINQFNSDADRDSLATLYDNIKFYMLQKDGRQRYVTKLAIMKLALKLGLSVGNGDTRVTLFFDVRQKGSVEIIENPDADDVSPDTARDPVSDTLTLVRSLLMKGESQTAAAVFFQNFAEEKDRAALLRERSVVVFGLVTREERAAVMSGAMTVADIVLFARLLDVHTSDPELGRIYQMRLTKTLAHGLEIGRLSDVLKEMLMTDTAREVGESLLSTGLFYGDAKTANALEAAYEAIPNKPAHWYTAADIYQTAKLCEDANGSKSATTVLEGLHVHFARLTETNPPDRNDSLRIRTSIRILANLYKKVSVELRERIVQKIIGAYTSVSQTHSQAVDNFVREEIAGQLKSLRRLIYDDDLILACDRIVISHGYMSGLPFYVTGRFTDEKYLIDCINARDERSMRALFALVAMRTQQNRTDKVPVNLSGFVINRVYEVIFPNAPFNSNYTGFDFTGAAFVENATLVRTKIYDLGFRTLKAGGRTDFTKFCATKQADKQVFEDELWTHSLEDVEINGTTFTRQINAGCRRLKNVTVHLDLSSSTDSIEPAMLNNQLSIFNGVDLDNCRFLVNRNQRQNLQVTAKAVTRFSLSGRAYDMLRSCGIDTFLNVDFNDQAMLTARLDGTRMDGASFNRLYKLGRRKFSGVTFFEKITDISGCEFENCTFEQGALSVTKADAVAIRSLKALGTTDISALVIDYASMMNENLDGLTINEAQFAGVFALGRRDFSGARIGHSTLSILPRKITSTMFAALKTCNVLDFSSFDLSNPSLIDADLNGCTISIAGLLAMVRSGRRHFEGMTVGEGTESVDDSRYYLDSIDFVSCRFGAGGSMSWIFNKLTINIHVNAETILSLKGSGVTDVRGLILDIKDTDCLAGMRIGREQVIHLPGRMRDNKAVLNGVVLQEEDLSGLNLIGVEFRGCTIRNCKLDNAKVSPVTCATLLASGVSDVSMCDVENCSWVDAEINGLIVTPVQYRIMCSRGLRNYQTEKLSPGRVGTSEVLRSGLIRLIKKGVRS